MEQVDLLLYKKNKKKLKTDGYGTNSSLRLENKKEGKAKLKLRRKL